MAPNGEMTTSIVFVACSTSTPAAAPAVAFADDAISAARRAERRQALREFLVSLFPECPVAKVSGNVARCFWGATRKRGVFRFGGDKRKLHVPP